MFQHFTVERWVKWLNAFLSYEPHEPDFPVGREELHLALMRLYRMLDTKGSHDRFAEAITTIYESTPHHQTNAEQLYYLLQLITYTKPLRAKSLVRRHLFEDSLVNVSYGPYKLQRRLLVASTRYDISDIADELIEYIYRTSKEDTDFKYLLLCLDILLTPPLVSEGCRFMERVISAIESEVEAVQLCMQLRADLPIAVYKTFYMWYPVAAERLASQFPKQAEWFKQALKRFVLPPLEVVSEFNVAPYAVLLSARFQAEERLLNAKELYTVASQCEVIGEEIVIDALSDIWSKRASTAHQNQPWRYDSAAEFKGMFWDQTDQRQISVNGINPEQAFHNVDAQTEPRIDAVFESVKRRFAVIKTEPLVIKQKEFREWGKAFSEGRQGSLPSRAGH
jgi:hypothetical protein